jgi:hypothetical protein
MEIPSRGGVPNGGVGFPSIGTFRTTEYIEHTEFPKDWKPAQ